MIYLQYHVCFKSLSVVAEQIGFTDKIVGLEKLVTYKNLANGSSTVVTNITANALNNNTKAFIYIASYHFSTGDATYHECGILRVGYNGNHLTKYIINKYSRVTTDNGDITFSVSGDGYIQYTNGISTPLSMLIFG